MQLSCDSVSTHRSKNSRHTPILSTQSAQGLEARSSRQRRAAGQLATSAKAHTHIHGRDGTVSEIPATMLWIVSSRPQESDIGGERRTIGQSAGVCSPPHSSAATFYVSLAATLDVIVWRHRSCTQEAGTHRLFTLRQGSARRPATERPSMSVSGT